MIESAAETNSQIVFINFSFSIHSYKIINFVNQTLFHKQRKKCLFQKLLKEIQTYLNQMIHSKFTPNFT